MSGTSQFALGAHLQRRIVSLLPAATETVFAMGLGGELVGRSHECDFPEAVTELPVCSRSRVYPSGLSGEIHQQVSAAVPGGALEALSIYEVNVETLAALEPTHILTQTLCDVCAVSEDTVARALSETGIDAQIVATHVRTMADYWAHFVQMGSMLGATEEAIQLVARLQDRLAVVEQKTLPLADRPRVVTIEWLDPLMVAGNWMPELIGLAGGRSVLGEAGERSPWVEWEQIVAARPDVLVISPCGFSVDQSLRELHRLRDRAGWSDLPAVEQRRVFVMDGNAYLHRPGPRLIDSAEILAGMMWPETFPLDAESGAWKAVA